MNKRLSYSDLTLKYLILSLPILLISGPLLPEIAVGIIFIITIIKIFKKEIIYFNKIFTFGFLFFYFTIIIS